MKITLTADEISQILLKHLVDTGRLSPERKTWCSGSKTSMSFTQSKEVDEAAAKESKS